MNFLFLHQNFPGQYKHLAPTFAAVAGSRVVAMGERKSISPADTKVEYRPYPSPKGATAATHHYIRDLEAAVRRGQVTAREAFRLRQEGFIPHVIFAHPGWGDALYLKDIFPESRLVNLFEFFYRSRGSDLNFDAEFPAVADDALRVRSKNAINLLSLDSCDWGVSPTEWQKRQYPEIYHPKISVIHDGVDTQVIRPLADRAVTIKEIGLTLTARDEVVTYVSRNLEPYRGFHSFMRALPMVLERRPKARVLIVGGNQVSYGRPPKNHPNWRAAMLAELEGKLDLSRIHFFGKVPYDVFQAVLQVSSAHIYLTYPFVLSWSMLEAMASGCALIGSRTAPVEEVITHGQNGLLADIFNPAEIADRIVEALASPDRNRAMRERARQTVIERYDLRTKALPAFVQLVNTLVQRRPAVQVAKPAPEPAPEPPPPAPLPDAAESSADNARTKPKSKRR